MPLPIETDRLLIRALTRGDLAALHETLRSDPEVMRYLTSPVATTVEETAATLERWMAHQDNDGLAQWAVVQRASGIFIGVSGIHPAEWVGPEVEISYSFGRRHWGHGFATEAARACLAFGFDELGIKRIVAFIAPANSASIHVAEKLGMLFEGIVPSRGHEAACYAATRGKP